jgi:hypothetical protein
VGPFSIILAQNNTSFDLDMLPISDLSQSTSRKRMTSGTSQNFHQEEHTTLADQYYTRYVHSLSTPYLRMPNNCSLFRQEDFVNLMGSVAVDETVQAQSSSMFTDSTSNSDPFQKYLGTCDYGNVKPLLPLFRFDFITDPNQIDERLEVSLRYKLLTMPRPKDFMYDLYPFVQKRFNAADLGFHISGPYCYGEP